MLIIGINPLVVYHLKVVLLNSDSTHSLDSSILYLLVHRFQNADHISEALKQLHSWNPTWKPCFFMTDYSEAEQCFSGIQVAIPLQSIVF